MENQDGEQRAAKLFPLDESSNEPHQQSLYAYFHGDAGSGGAVEKNGQATDTMPGGVLCLQPPEDFLANMGVLESTDTSPPDAVGRDAVMMDGSQNLAAEPFNNVLGNLNPSNLATATEDSLKLGPSTTTTGTDTPLGGNAMMMGDACMPLPPPAGHPSTPQEQPQQLQQQQWTGTGNMMPSTGLSSSLLTMTRSNTMGANTGAPSSSAPINDVSIAHQQQAQQQQHQEQQQLCESVLRQNLLLRQMLLSQNALMMFQPWGAYLNPQLQQQLPFQLPEAVNQTLQLQGAVLPNVAAQGSNIAVAFGDPGVAARGLLGAPSGSSSRTSSSPSGIGVARKGSVASSEGAASSLSDVGAAAEQSYPINTGYGDLKKPKRPLSAYNLFFKDERVNLLNEVQRKAEESGAKPSGRAKVSFENMAKIIGGRWKRLDPERIAEYKQRAAVDKDRYDRQMKAFNEQKLRLLEKERRKQEKSVPEEARRK